MPYEKIGKNEPVCIADEVPFEIPDSWEWVRLKNLSIKIGAGSTPQGGKNIYVSKGIKFIRSQNVYNDGLYLKNIVYIPEEINAKKAGSIVYPKDILLNITGGSIGRCAIVPEQFDIGNVNQHVMIIRLIKAEIRSWIHFVLVSDYIQKLIMEVQVGVSREGLSASKLKDFLIPIPPLNELKRIVDKIEHLLPHIEKYKDLEETKQSLDKKFPNKLKNAILQWAVQGKLVKQNANDGSAKLLLNHIYKEKIELLNKGKIKKDKHESIIFRRDNSYYEKLDGVERCIDDEIPFEIPDSWEWVRLGKISTYAESKKKINVLNVDSDFWQLDLEDIERGGKILRFKTVKEGKGVGDKTFFSKGDILYSKLRPYLLKILIAPADGICTPEIVPFQLYAGIIPEYIVAFLKSPYVDSVINSVTYGIKMPRVGTQTMVSLLVPVPPLEEQKRIVEYINKILPLISKL